MTAKQLADALALIAPAVDSAYLLIKEHHPILKDRDAILAQIDAAVRPIQSLMDQLAMDIRDKDYAPLAAQLSRKAMNALNGAIRNEEYEAYRLQPLFEADEKLKIAFTNLEKLYLDSPKA